MHFTVIVQLTSKIRENPLQQNVLQATAATTTAAAFQQQQQLYVAGAEIGEFCLVSLSIT